jgi:type IX secretion system PorP/SprF family membrane protein
MIKKILILFIALWPGILLAQQQFQLSQFFQSANMINPAVTGIEDFVDLKVGFRQQWSGFADAPRTYFISAHGAFKPKKGFMYEKNSLRISNPSLYQDLPGSADTKWMHGVGGYVIRDEQGSFKQMSSYGSYASHFQLGQTMRLSIGISAGISNRRWDIDQIRLRIPEDELYNTYLSQGVIENYFDVNAGMMLYSSNFFFGYSAAHLLQNKILADNENVGKLNIHHYIMAGYRFRLNDRLELLPSALIKYVDPAPPVVDFDIKAKYDQLLWAGIGYRHDNAIVAMAGFYLSDFLTISYSYDYITNDLGAYNSGTHEIALGFMLFNSQQSSPYMW